MLSSVKVQGPKVQLQKLSVEPIKYGHCCEDFSVTYVRKLCKNRIELEFVHGVYNPIDFFF